MNENKVPCGGFKVDPLFLGVEGEKLYFKAESIDGYGFMPGYCATLKEYVNEASGTDKWIMSKDDISIVSRKAISGVPVFVRIMKYLGAGEYAYSTGNLCYFEKGKKIIFSCFYSQGSTFSIKFYDVNMNNGETTEEVKQLS